MDNHNKAGRDQLSAALRLSPTRNAEAYLLPLSSQSLLVIGFPSMQIHYHRSACAAPARTRWSLLPGTKACISQSQIPTAEEWGSSSTWHGCPLLGCIQITLNHFKAREELLGSREPFSPEDIPPTPWFGSSTRTSLLLLTALMRQQFPAGVMENPTSSKQAVGPADIPAAVNLWALDVPRWTHCSFHQPNPAGAIPVPAVTQPRCSLHVDAGRYCSTGFGAQC